MDCGIELSDHSAKGCDNGYEPMKRRINFVMAYNFNRQKEMDFAVSEERYEDAAILRDGGYVDRCSPGTYVIKSTE